MQNLLLLLLTLTTSCVIAQTVSIKNTSKVKVKKKLLKVWRAEQLHLQSNNKWISSAGAYCEIWKKDKHLKSIHLYHYHSNGDLILDGTVIKYGNFQYDYKTDKYKLEPDYVELVKQYHPTHIASKTIYEISHAVFDTKKERLVLSLRYRPTRIPNFKEGKLPRNLFALLDTNADSVITFLDESPIFNPYDIKLTPNYIVALYRGTDSVAIWNLSDGQRLQSPLANILTIGTHRNGNDILCINKDGTVFQHNISSNKNIDIVTDKSIVSAFLIAKNTFLLVDNKNHCTIHRKTTIGKIKLLYEFESNDIVNDVFYNEATSELCVATKHDDFPIIFIEHLNL